MTDNFSGYLRAKFYGEPIVPQNLRQLVQWVQWNVVYLIYNTYWNPATQSWKWVPLIKDVVISYFILHFFYRIFLHVYGYGIIASTRHLFNLILKRIIDYVMSFSIIRGKIQKQLKPTIEKIEKELMKDDTSLLTTVQLPEEGYSKDTIIEELDGLLMLKHSDWKKGRISGAVYHGGDELLELQTEAYRKYAVANQLHPDVFPGLRKMEAEVVSMVLKLFNAPKSGCGSTTSGGTESLLLAGLAAREFGKRKKGIKEPEVIAPVTVHAGIEKACYYFGMQLHKVPLDEKTYQVDVNKVRRLINNNTVLLVGSAPNFPHGIIDDIEALSQLAVKHSIPLHVDCCLGSFIVPFLDAYYGKGNAPVFDFRNKGVTSISCDTHKYGFAPKGSSIIMYSSPELRECQYYVLTDWTGGLYGSPTLAGSRPGALMVGCWATLVNIGRNGYLKMSHDIVASAMSLKKVLQEHELLSKYLVVLGDPVGPVVSFTVREEYAKDLNVYELGDSLSQKDWHFALLQNPAALHFAFTKLSIPVVQEMVDDLIASIEFLLENSKGDKKSIGETAAFYGVAGSIQTSGIADRLIVAFLDTLYKL